MLSTSICVLLSLGATLRHTKFALTKKGISTKEGSYVKKWSPLVKTKGDGEWTGVQTSEHCMYMYIEFVY